MVIVIAVIDLPDRDPSLIVLGKPAPLISTKFPSDRAPSGATITPGKQTFPAY